MGEGVADIDTIVEPGRKVVDKILKLAHNTLSHGVKQGCWRCGRHRHRAMTYLTYEGECLADTEDLVYH